MNSNKLIFVCLGVRSEPPVRQLHAAVNHEHYIKGRRSSLSKVRDLEHMETS